MKGKSKKIRKSPAPGKSPGVGVYTAEKWTLIVSDKGEAELWAVIMPDGQLPCAFGTEAWCKIYAEHCNETYINKKT